MTTTRQRGRAPRLVSWSPSVTSIVRAVVVAGCAFVFGCRLDLCGNDLVNEHVSPDRRHKLVVFRRSCGATSGFSVHASLLKVGESIKNESGNAFVAEDLRDPGQAETMSRTVVRVQWMRPDRVFLRHGFFGKVFKAEPRVQGVSIEYEHAR
jgi:hypothetical protein